MDQSLATDKARYYDSICATAERAARKNDHRELYTIMNKLNGKRRHNTAATARNCNGEVATSKEESLNEWAKYFSDLLNYTTSCDTDVPPALNDLDISVTDFTEVEFDEALIQCKLGKSPGIDTAIRAETLRCVAVSVVMLNNNKYFESVIEYYMDTHRHGNGRPISYTCTQEAKYVYDYRSITLMSVAGKIYNRMLLNRIYDPVNATLRTEQVAFRRGRSCIEQIHTLRRLRLP